MPQPVKLSDLLIAAAREASADAHRSLASQVEHWATLGRAIETQLTAQDSAALKRAVAAGSAGAFPSLPPPVVARVKDALNRVLDPKFSERVGLTFSASSLSAYGTHADFPGQLVRRDPDGTLTPGVMIKRKFHSRRAHAKRA